MAAWYLDPQTHALQHSCLNDDCYFSATKVISLCDAFPHNSKWIMHGNGRGGGVVACVYSKHFKPAMDIRSRLIGNLGADELTAIDFHVTLTYFDVQMIDFDIEFKKLMHG